MTNKPKEEILEAIIGHFETEIEKALSRGWGKLAEGVWFGEDSKSFLSKAIDKAVEEERVRWKKNLKQHFEQLKRSGWITNDKDMIDAINQVIE